jgi:hypothetical protein
MVQATHTVAGRNAARTLGTSTALNPSTSQGGHPNWRGAAVAATMASSVLARADEMIE